MNNMDNSKAKGRLKAMKENVLESVTRRGDSGFMDRHLRMLEDPALLEKLVGFGNSYIRSFEDAWIVGFLTMASVYAPSIMQGEKKHRSQCHVLLIGEYSTSKTTFTQLCKQMFPKVIAPSEFTAPALIGTIDKHGKKHAGLAEQADRGIILLDELDKLIARNKALDGLLRVAMEEQYFRREMAYGTLEYSTKSCVIAGANPTDDVFHDIELDRQMPFRRGLLSRFDFVRPIVYGKEQISDITRFISKHLFTDEPTISPDFTTTDIMRMFSALQYSLNKKKVIQVATDDGHMDTMQARFEELQEIIKGVPLLSVRDYMSVLRWFNASATLNHARRDIERGVIYAADEDMENALYVLDASTKNRKVLLTSSTRRDLERCNEGEALEILIPYLKGKDKLHMNEAAEILIEEMCVARSSAYKYLGNLVAEGVLKQHGKRNARLSLVKTS